MCSPPPHTPPPAMLLRLDSAGRKDTASRSAVSGETAGEGSGIIIPPPSDLSGPKCLWLIKNDEAGDVASGGADIRSLHSKRAQVYLVRAWAIFTVVRHSIKIDIAQIGRRSRRPPCGPARATAPHGQQDRIFRGGRLERTFRTEGLAVGLQAGRCRSTRKQGAGLGHACAPGSTNNRAEKREETGRRRSGRQEPTCRRGPQTERTCCSPIRW